MKLQITKFERLAGLFVIVAFSGFAFFTAFVAFKQGWFASRHHYKAIFKQGQGLHAGTSVQIAGLLAGTVENVILTEDNQIEVTFNVEKRFFKKMNRDTVVRLSRPFIISDKVLEITPGANTSLVLNDGELVASQDTVDVMDLLGGGHLSPYFNTLDSLVKNVHGAADILPDIAEFTKQLPSLGENSAKIMADMEKFTVEMNKVLPALVQIAPQLPEASQKSVEALKEAIVVLKAMQKSIFLRSAVKDVKEEENESKQKRVPAGK